MSDQPKRQEMTVRRVPKFGAFMAVGGGLGAIVTLILTSLYPVDKNVGFGALFGYFALYGIPAGVVLGALVALVLDWRGRKRMTTVTAERETAERTDSASS